MVFTHFILKNIDLTNKKNSTLRKVRDYLHFFKMLFYAWKTLREAFQHHSSFDDYIYRE